MKIKAGTPKALAYAFGAVVAIHAAAIGSYFAFRSKPALLEEPLKSALTQRCSPQNNADVGEAALKPLYDSASRKCEVRDQVRAKVAFEVRNGNAAVDKITLQESCSIAPQPVNLDAVQFQSDCSGMAEVVLGASPQAYEGSKAPEICRKETVSRAQNRISSSIFSQVKIILSKIDEEPESSKLYVAYDVKGGKGTVTGVARIETHSLPSEYVNLAGIPFDNSTDCAGQYAVSIPRDLFDTQ